MSFFVAFFSIEHAEKQLARQAAKVASRRNQLQQKQSGRSTIANCFCTVASAPIGIADLATAAIFRVQLVIAYVFNLAVGLAMVAGIGYLGMFLYQLSDHLPPDVEVIGDLNANVVYVDDVSRDEPRNYSASVSGSRPYADRVNTPPYQSGFSSEQLTQVYQSVRDHSLSQNDVSVSGHYRGDSFISPHSRNAPGGDSAIEQFDASAKGVGAALGIMAIDAGMQWLQSRQQY